MPGTACISDLTATQQYVLIVLDMLVYFIAEVSSHSRWPLLEEIQDPELKGLADKLPETMLKSRADSKYVFWSVPQMEAMGFEAWGKPFPVDGKYLRSSVSPINWRDHWF